MLFRFTSVYKTNGDGCNTCRKCKEFWHAKWQTQSMLQLTKLGMIHVKHWESLDIPKALHNIWIPNFHKNRSNDTTVQIIACYWYI